MSVETPVQGAELEEALERATEEAIATAHTTSVLPDGEEEESLPEGQDDLRIILTVSMTVIAAAVMAGGIFLGASPRAFGGIAGILGVVIAQRAVRARYTWQMILWIAGGLLGTGLLLTLPAGVSSITNLPHLIKEAMGQGSLLRPPVLFLPGWHAVLGWIMACVGFLAGWIALKLEKPAMGMMIPMVLVAFSAISVAKDQQVVSGIVCLALLIIGLGLLSSLHQRGADDERPTLGYELRRAGRAAPVLLIVVGGLVGLLKLHILFPAPLYNPAEQARLPKRIPLSEVKDRVLFEVKAKFSGPWKVGTLDVYDGHDWRLPPFNPDKLKEVPSDGVVDHTGLKPAAQATFTLRGLSGAILPGVANTIGLVADIPSDMKISYDNRAGTLRITQGQFKPGFEYTIVAAGIPRIEQLRESARSFPKDIDQFLQMPTAPPAIQSVIDSAPKTNQWDRLDFVRQYLLKRVQAQGAGQPISITPARLADMITTHHTATPFEIVAGETMLARWVGIPARIGYGFDKGDPGREKDTYSVRPRNGALFIETYFTNYGWLPIIGDPLQAKIDLNEQQQQQNQRVTATNDVSISLIIPQLDPAKGELFREVRRILSLVGPALLLILLIYILWPLPYKVARRARRRSWAVRRGPAARIALAYAEFRDAVTDYGYPYSNDPPLMFLRRFSPDEEQAELAWLVTRVLWGDLRGLATTDDAVFAEELSTSLRQRLSRAHPFTLRMVAILSRLSVRDQYAPHLADLPVGAKSPEVVHAA